MFNSIRTKLTLWYTAILTLMLVGCCFSVYSILQHRLLVRLDEDLLAALDTTNSLLVSEGEENDSSQDSIPELIGVLHFSDIGLVIYDNAGHKLAEQATNGQPLPATIPSAWINHHELSLISWQSPTPSLPGKWRIAIRQIRFKNKDHFFYAVVIQSLRVIHNQLELLRDIFFLIIPIGIVLASFFGWLFAKKSLAPVAIMTERVQHIYADNLDERLPIKQTRDEIGRLAQTFNDLLSRLQAAFQKERQFMADAAHELRTPLYVVRTAVDVTLKQPQRSETEYREALQMVSQQERRLTRIVEDLFLLSCAADGGRRLETSNFYLDELIQDTVKVISILAREKGVAVEAVVIPGTCFHGDEALLRQMLLNLLDNAVKYIPAEAKVIVTLQVTATAVRIEVADAGPGIPADVHPHIFERFYRGDQARSHRDKGMGAGAGLGLPIARWIAEAHGGTIVLSRSDSQGSLFSITLPRTVGAET